MARPTKITDEQILDAARQIFLEKGAAATTAEVARAAGVAEGSVFKRWKTKQELFFAAMSPGDGDPEWVRNLHARVGRGEVQETLTEVGLQAVEFFRRIMPLAMMCWSNPPTGKVIPPPLQGPNSLPVRAIKKIAGFFEAEIRLGRIARRDPEVMARSFLGSIQHFTFVEIITHNRDELPMPAEMFIRGLVSLLWNGICPAEMVSPKESLR